MQSVIKRAALVGLVSAAALAAAPTAHANWLPANANVNFLARNPALTYSGINIRCATLTSRGRTPAAGVSSLSLDMAFANCTAAGLPAAARCVGFKTLTIRAFANPSATGAITFDRGFDCTFAIPALACSISFSGPQAAGNFDFTNGTQVLREAFRFNGTDTGGGCRGNTPTGNAGPMTLVANSTPDITITTS